LNLAFISEAGGGKDFLAQHTITNYGYTRYAFATHVNNVAKKWFPDLYGDGKEKPRWLLQAIGTKFREVDPDVWIKAMLKEIDEEASNRRRYMEIQEHIVVTDCRMPNEYQALKERGFTFIRIHVDGEIRKQRLLDRKDKFSENDMNHHTESFYDQFECDFVITNNGTQEVAYRQLDDVIDIVRAKVGVESSG